MLIETWVSAEEAPIGVGEVAPALGLMVPQVGIQVAAVVVA